MAERTLTAYERVLEQAPKYARSRRRRRARVALVSPWPPERSGIADYNLRLARELGAHVDVDVVVGLDLSSYAPPQEHGVRLVTSRSFRLAEALRQPDRVVYCMGNSSFHGHVYELLRERPGVVVAHDVRLTGFYGWFAGRERPEDPAGRLRERIEALYGGRLPRSAYSNGPPDWERQSALGIYMTSEIQEYAEQLLVHSRYAQNVLALDRPALARPARTSVVSFGIPNARATDRPATQIGDTPTIISVGVVSEVKGLATLIAAVGQLAGQRTRVRLRIAGPADDDELQRWRDFAAQTAPNTDIELTGHLSADSYRALLDHADLAVQLRTLSNGEASAAVADCLAAGLPTVVTDIGWAAELPADAVIRVPLHVSPPALAATLEQVLSDIESRHALSTAALCHTHECSFGAIAQEYLEILGLR